MMLLQVAEMSAKLEELEDELDELTSAMDEEHALSRLEVKGTCIEITTHTQLRSLRSQRARSDMHLFTH